MIFDDDEELDLSEYPEAVREEIKEVAVNAIDEVDKSDRQCECGSETFEVTIDDPNPPKIEAFTICETCGKKSKIDIA